MSGDLIPASGALTGAGGRRQDRTLARALSSLDRSQAVGLARIEQQAQLEAARAHAVNYVGQQAMQAVAMTSQLEAQLGQACPMAVTRLQGIADMTALAVSDVVMNSARKIGR